jgi:predicted amidohydrolase YtcJ
MTSSEPLIIRDVAVVDGPRRDLAIAHGRIVSHLPNRKARVIDGGGLLALPGLIDHHFHILAAAAMLDSADLSHCSRETDIVALLRQRAASDAGAGLRATGYDERVAGLLDRHMLDRWLPDRELRVQDRTGALWVLNSRLISRLGDGPYPSCVDMAEDGAPTGRIWRGDSWLRKQLGSQPPPVNRVAHRLLSLGITGVTDASCNNGPEEGRLFSKFVRHGDWPLRLQLMGREDLPSSPCYRQGPLKLHYDETRLPSIDELTLRIAIARKQGRAVAAHCVTEAELVWFLTALDDAGGARTGDRIEHGAVIPTSLLAAIARTPLSVISNPGFLLARGDRYLDTISQDDRPDLYRLGSLSQAGIAVHVASDAPYGPDDPWAIMRAASDRRTASGRTVNSLESLPVDKAITSYLHDFTLSAPRSLSIGEVADLCLLSGNFEDVLSDPAAERIVATIVAGKIRYADGRFVGEC